MDKNLFDIYLGAMTLVMGLFLLSPILYRIVDIKQSQTVEEKYEKLKVTILIIVWFYIPLILIFIILINNIKGF